MSAFSIRESASFTASMVQAIDFAAVAVGGWLAFQIRFWAQPGWAPWGGGESLITIGASVVAALLFSKIYRMWAGGSLPAMVGRVTVGWAMTWTLLLVVLVFTKTTESFSRGWLLTWLPTTTLLLWVGRTFAFFFMAHMRRAGYYHKKVVLYGESKMLHTVKARIEQAAWSGYDIVATVRREDGTDLGALDDNLKPDEIWISVSMSEHSQLDEVMYALRNSVANIRLLPDLMMYQMLNHGMSVTVGIPMVDVSVSPMYGGRRVVKVVLDYTVATVALILLSPVLLAIAAAIKLTSKGPVLFKQARHGWNDEEIWVYKFRSMTEHTEDSGVVTQATRNDPRVTPLGQFLRRTSLDELPQFINVLQGRMSVVGPRPHALAHNEAYLELIPKYALRHKVKPGITGWAQVCGYRGETDTLEKMEGRLQHDIHYLENWSLWLDIKIIFLTPLATIQNKNVY
jgi:putative colanic acid biosynthesis UDP-glucose lipid carrier transferase